MTTWRKTNDEIENSNEINVRKQCGEFTLRVNRALCAARTGPIKKGLSRPCGNDRLRKRGALGRPNSIKIDGLPRLISLRPPSIFFDFFPTALVALVALVGKGSCAMQSAEPQPIKGKDHEQ